MPAPLAVTHSAYRVTFLFTSRRRLWASSWWTVADHSCQCTVRVRLHPVLAPRTQEVVGALILLLNTSMLLAFLLLLGRKAWPAASRVVTRMRTRAAGSRGLARRQQSKPCELGA